MDKANFFKTLLDTFRQVWHLELYRSGDHNVVMSQLLIALMIIIGGLWISRRVAALFGSRIGKIGNLQHNTAYFLQKILHYLLIVVVVLIALPIAGIPITIFTVLGGAIAIGVGFGAQNLFNNLISGIIIMLEKPIRIGDIIELENSEGKIADIGNRCVRVRRTDGVDVLTPNSHFLEQPVINWTLFDSDVRGQVNVGVAYGSDTRKVRDLIEQAAREDQRILQDKEILVLFDEFGDNALHFTLLFWANITRPMDRRRIQSDLRYRIDALFRENHITIAFPQRDVHLDSLSPIEVRLKQDS